jgi:hypothetical protein
VTVYQRLSIEKTLNTQEKKTNIKPHSRFILDGYKNEISAMALAALERIRIQTSE